MNKKNIIIKLIKILLIILTIYGFLNLLNNIINPDKQLNIFGIEFHIADFSTIKPKTSKGDLIISKYCGEDNLNVGDFIVFKKEGKVLIRKIDTILERNSGNVYITREEGSDNIDNWQLSLGKIEGKYCFRIIKMGYIFKIFNNAICIIIIIISPIIFKIYYSKKTRKGRKKNESQIKK